MSLGTYKFLKRSLGDDVPLFLEKAQEMFDELLRYHQMTLKMHHFTAEDLDSTLCEANRLLWGIPKKDIFLMSSMGELQNVITIRKKKINSKKGYRPDNTTNSLTMYAGGHYDSLSYRYQDLSEGIRFHCNIGELDDWTQRGGYVHANASDAMPSWVKRMRPVDPITGELQHFHSNVFVAPRIELPNDPVIIEIDDDESEDNEDGEGDTGCDSGSIESWSDVDFE